MTLLFAIATFALLSGAVTLLMVYLEFRRLTAAVEFYAYSDYEGEDDPERASATLHVIPGRE